MDRKTYKDLWSRYRMVKDWDRHARLAKAEGRDGRELMYKQIGAGINRRLMEQLFWNPSLEVHFVRAFEWNEGQRNKSGGAR